MKISSFLIIVIVINTACLNANSNISNKTADSAVFKRNEIGINIATYLGLYYSNHPTIFIQSIVYRRNLNAKNSLYFSASIREKIGLLNPEYTLYETPGDTIVLQRSIENYSAIRLVANYEKNWVKKHVLYYLGTGIYIERGRRYSDYENYYLAKSPMSSYSYNNVTLYDYKFIRRESIYSSNIYSFEAGINIVGGIKIPLSKRFILSANTGIEIGVAINNFPSYNSQNKYHYSTFELYVPENFISECSLAYRF